MLRIRFTLRSSDGDISRILYKTLLEDKPSLAELHYIFSPYFISKYTNRGAEVTDLDRYHGAAQYVFCDVFKKKFILIPVNKRCIVFCIVLLAVLIAFHRFHWYLIIVKSLAVALDHTDQTWYAQCWNDQLWLTCMIAFYSHIFVLDSMLSNIPHAVIHDVKMFFQMEAKQRYGQELDLDKFQPFLVSVRTLISEHKAFS